MNSHEIESMERNKITIVIPVYNREKQIVRTLDSLANQNLDNVSVTIVDNNSTDRTLEIVREWITNHDECDFKIMTEETKGAPAARNAGLGTVTTPYVMFFDSDDEMLPGHLEMIKDGLKDYPDAEILGWEVDQELPSGRRQTGCFEETNVLYHHLIHSILATQRYIVKTDVIRQAGGWDNSVRGWNDYELGVRLLLTAKKVVKLNKGGRPTVRINFTQTSITGSSFADDCEKWEHSLELIEKTLISKRPEAVSWLTYRRAVLAADYLREGDFKNCRRLFKNALCSPTSPLLTSVLFLNHLILHRGSWIIASLFLPKV